ncbi:MAG: hypothetical protein LAT64_10130 [Phycisphaerales bacterium]|nr:hypothetical protein [Planctomycetota bacterium]MCH8509108.1 hypothetical protein [Phycisphaerales bacterium]
MPRTPRHTALAITALISLALGFLITIGTAALLFTVLFPTTWTVTGSLPIDQTPPTYLAPIAPPLTEIYRTTASGPLDAVPLPGVDSIVFEYGPSLWSDAYQPWDPAASSDPTFVSLTRYRFGWPRRFLSMDSITTGQSVADPVVMAYHQRANDLAAEHRGLNRPAWVPRFIPIHRVPAVVDRTNLAINTAFWALICFGLIQCRYLIKAAIRRRRTRRGLCARCRYELQGLNTCPECGSPAPSPTATS